MPPKKPVTEMVWYFVCRIALGKTWFWTGEMWFLPHITPLGAKAFMGPDGKRRADETAAATGGYVVGY